MSKRLYRSNSNKMIAGVCGGLGEYFDIDPTIVRLVFLMATFFGGTGILLYIIGAIVIPVDPTSNYGHTNQRPQPQSQSQQTENFKQPMHAEFSDSTESAEPASKINLDKKEDNA